MQKMGNTHFCFVCVGRSGFKLDEQSMPINVHPDEVTSFSDHSAEHAEYVVGNAEKYPDVWSWLEAEIPADFPYIVAVP
jgi:hypothetical protein